MKKMIFAALAAITLAFAAPGCGTQVTLGLGYDSPKSQIKYRGEYSRSPDGKRELKLNAQK